MDEKPTVQLSASPQATMGEPHSVTFAAGDDQGLRRVVIDWGNGDSDTIPANAERSISGSRTHIYDAAGSYTVRGEAEDVSSQTTTEEVNLSVEAPHNTPPTASIDAPSDGSSFSHGEAITFEGSATDPEDGKLQDDALAWRSSSDGKFGSGASITTSGLSAGSHTITLTATDSDGADGSTSIDLIVQSLEENEPPSAIIEQPASGATFVEGETVTFMGSATDPEDGTLQGDALTWRSSHDGHIGHGTSTSTSGLSVGKHTITLQAIDSEGASDTTSISITISSEQSNSAPSASIIQPADGASFTQDQSIELKGSATDPEDGTLQGSALVWSSSQVGELGTGQSLSVGSLSLGTHQITLTATDSDGASDSDQITLSVEAASGPPSWLGAYNGAVDVKELDTGEFHDDRGSIMSLAYISSTNTVEVDLRWLNNNAAKKRELLEKCTFTSTSLTCSNEGAGWKETFNLVFSEGRTEGKLEKFDQNSSGSFVRVEVLEGTWFKDSVPEGATTAPSYVGEYDGFADVNRHDLGEEYLNASSTLEITFSSYTGLAEVRVVWNDEGSAKFSGTAETVRDCVPSTTLLECDDRWWGSRDVASLEFSSGAATGIIETFTQRADGSFYKEDTIQGTWQKR